MSVWSMFLPYLHTDGLTLARAGVLPRGRLGWTCPPHSAQFVPAFDTNPVSFYVEESRGTNGSVTL